MKTLQGLGQREREAEGSEEGVAGHGVPVRMLGFQCERVASASHACYGDAVGESGLNAVEEGMRSIQEGDSHYIIP